jgi:hypothetical protein
MESAFTFFSGGSSDMAMMRAVLDHVILSFIRTNGRDASLRVRVPSLMAEQIPLSPQTIGGSKGSIIPFTD